MNRKYILVISVILFSFSIIFTGVSLAAPNIIEDLKKKIIPSQGEEKLSHKENLTLDEEVESVENQEPITKKPPKPTPKTSITQQEEYILLPSPSLIALPTPTPKPDNSSKLKIISDIFGTIGKLNAQLVSYSYLQQNTANNYDCDPHKWDDSVFDPFVRDEMYQQCLENAKNLVNSYSPQINSIKDQIRSLNSQAFEVAKTCPDDECINYHWDFVTTYKSNGWLVR